MLLSSCFTIFYVCRSNWTAYRAAVLSAIITAIRAACWSAYLSSNSATKWTTYRPTFLSAIVATFGDAVHSAIFQPLQPAHIGPIVVAKCTTVESADCAAIGTTDYAPYLGSFRSADFRAEWPADFHALCSADHCADRAAQLHSNNQSIDSTFCTA